MVTTRSSSRAASAQATASAVEDTFKSDAPTASVVSGTADTGGHSVPTDALTLARKLPKRTSAQTALRSTRSPSTTTNFSSLPSELQGQIVGNFRAGAPEVIRVSVVNKALQAALQDKLKATALIHKANVGVPGRARTMQDLREVLQDLNATGTKQLPLAMRAQVISEVVRQIGFVHPSPVEAGTVLALIADSLEQMQHSRQGDNEPAFDETLKTIAGQFSESDFTNAVAVRFGDGVPTALTTQNFFQRFRLLVQARPGEAFAQLRADTASGLYMIGDVGARTAEWKRLFATCNPDSDHDHPLIVVLGHALNLLPPQEDREQGRIALMALLPKLTTHDRSRVISALIVEAARNPAHPNQLDLIEALWQHGVALNEPAPRAFVAATLLACLSALPPALRHTWYQRTVAVLESIGNADTQDYAPRLGLAIRHLPEQAQRLQALSFLALKINSLGESARSQTLNAAICALIHIDDEVARQEYFSHFCQQVGSMTPEKIGLAIDHLAVVVHHWGPTPLRHGVINDLLLVIGQTDGAILKAHLMGLAQRTIESAPLNEVQHVLYWIQNNARRLPVGERAEVISEIVARAFADRFGPVLHYVLPNLHTTVYGLPAAEVTSVYTTVIQGLAAINREVHEGIAMGGAAQVQLQDFRRLCTALSMSPSEIVDVIAEDVIKTATEAHIQGMPYTVGLLQELRAAGLLDRCLAAAPSFVATLLRAQLPLDG